MAAAKIAISLDEETVGQLDRLVSANVYPSRSRAIQVAVHEKLARLNRSRLARECAKLDVEEEQELAEAGVVEDGIEWPEY